MKKITLIVFIFFSRVVLYGQYIYISGSVYRLSHKEIPVKIHAPLRDPVIQGYESVKDMYPDKLNKFTSTLKLTEPGIFFVSYGERSKEYFFSPGDTIQLLFRQKNKPDTIRRNKLQTDLIGETVTVVTSDLPRVTFFDSLEKKTGLLDIGTFVNEADSKLSHDLFLKRINYLEFYTKKYNLDSNFYALAYSEIKGIYLCNLVVQGYSTSNFYDSSGYYKDLFTDDYNWSKVKNARSYITAISSFTNVFLRKNGWNSTSSEEKLAETFENILNRVGDEQTRNYFLTDLLSQTIEMQPGNFDELYERYNMLCTDTIYLNGIKKLSSTFFAKYKNVPISKEVLNAGLFSMELNKPIKIKDVLALQKPVLVDFWASWCGPCLQEMKPAHEFEKKYKNKISFVYISVDSKYSNWRKIIAKESLSGHHYLLTNGFNSKLASMLKMKSVPRQIIIKGNRVIVFKGASPLDTEVYNEMLKNSLN